MGWCGYGIYSGDGTQSCHYDFLRRAKIKRRDIECEEVMSFRRTILNPEMQKLLRKNIGLVLKKMPKVPKSKFVMFDEYSAIEWQMLLALFVDNKMTIPKEIFTNGLYASEYLMGEHASEFNDPSRRRKSLRRFMDRARSVYCKE